MGSSEFLKKRRSPRSKFTSLGDHNKFVSRIKKSLYYGQLPSTERLSLPVTELATELFSASQRKHSLQRLDLEEASEVSRSACVSPCSLVLALLYLERLQSLHPSYLSDTPPSELYLVSLMVATKFLQDDGEEDGVINEEWATSAGISIKHLNQLERSFLAAIDWEVYVSEEAFWTRLRGLERDVALNEGSRRGWFSYADLDCLLEKVDLASLAHSVLLVSAVCLTSYTASILTLIASTLLVGQIQPMILSGVLHSGVNQSNVPLSSMDTVASETLIDSNLTPDYQLPGDVLKTNFILASINSCGERLGNNSRNCFDKAVTTKASFTNRVHGTHDKHTEENTSASLYTDYMNWTRWKLDSWLKLIQNFNVWFKSPLSGSFEQPPDWATTVSYCVDRSPSLSRLIPLQVY